MTWKNTMRRWVTASATLAMVAGMVQAAPVSITDGFGDADRDNDGATDGSVVTDAGDTGIKWLAMEVEADGITPNPTFSIVDDSAGIGSGNALFVEQTGSNAEVYVPLGQAVSLALGETMTISFDIRYEVGTAALSSGTQLRFGPWNADEANFHSAGPTEFGAAEGDFDASSPGALLDTGFQVRVPVGTSADSGAAVIEEFNINSILGGSGDGDTVVSSGGSLPAISDSLAHTIEMVITRTIESGLEGTRTTVTIDGLGALSGFEPVGTGINASTFEWDYMAFNNTRDAEYYIDNFSLTVVPEPASLALVGLGGLMMLRHRK